MGRLWGQLFWPVAWVAVLPVLGLWALGPRLIQPSLDKAARQALGAESRAILSRISLESTSENIVDSNGYSAASGSGFRADPAVSPLARPPSALPPSALPPSALPPSDQTLEEAVTPSRPTTGAESSGGRQGGLEPRLEPDGVLGSSSTGDLPGGHIQAWVSIGGGGWRRLEGRPDVPCPLSPGGLAGREGQLLRLDGPPPQRCLGTQQGAGRQLLVCQLEEDPARARALVWRLGWLCLGVGAPGLWLAWRRARGQSQLVSELTHILGRLRRGELQARVAEEGAQDVQALGRELNALVRQLRAQLVALQEDHRRLQGILEGMSEGVLVTNQAGGVVLVNQALLRMLEVPATVVGRPLLETFRSPRLAQALHEAQQSRGPVTFELAEHYPLARQLLVRVSRWGEAEEVGGVVAVLHDVTEMRRLEQVRRDFVANASHELRTPVAAVRGTAEALLDGDPLPEEARSLVEVIERNARRLASLVDDILRLANMERPGYRVELGPVRVEAVAETVIKGLSRLARERNLQLKQVFVPHLPPAWADREALEHVLINLVDNALKYTAPGGQVEVRGRRDGDRLLLEVEDSGVGIPEAELPRVFERFYRVDPARSRAVGGTGLGLSIARHLVQAMGGDLSVRSVVGQGSTFTVVLRRVPEPSRVKVE